MAFFQILENIQPLARAVTNPTLEGYRKVEANSEQIILESALTNVGNDDVTTYSGNMVINAVKGIQTNKLYPIVNNDEYAFVQYGHLVSTVGSYDYNRVKTVGVWMDGKTIFRQVFDGLETKVLPDLSAEDISEIISLHYVTDTTDTFTGKLILEYTRN